MLNRNRSKSKNKTVWNTWRKIIISICLCICTFSLFAQDKITGKVTDANGEVVVDVGVMVKGTSNGVVTDQNGGFTIQAGSDAILVISALGYKEQEITVGNRTTLDITLVEDAQLIEEVVVVGYGTQKKVNLTGAVSTIKVDEKIAGRSLSNVSSGLSGLAPGLSVTQSTGMAGTNNANLLIRGMGTINNANPLIVVDGMPDVDINRLNMNDIESISILKDATSSAIYGSRAANGVILVTTKSGKGQEKTHIDFNGSYGTSHYVNSLQYLSDYPRAMTVFQRAQLTGKRRSETNMKDGTIDQWMALGMIDPIKYPNTDWWDVIMRNGGIQNYNLSASGSSDKANFYASVGIMDENGLQIHNDFTRYNARFNFDYKVRNNVTVGVRFDGNWSKYLYPYSAIGFSDTPNNQIQYAIAGITPYDPETGHYGATMAYGEDNAANPLGYYDNRQYHINRQEANSSFYGIWEIFKGLTARVDYALNYYNQFNWNASTPYGVYNFQTNELRYTEVAANTGVSNTTNTGYKTLLNGQLNYHKLIAGHHDLNLMFAYSEEYWYARSQSASRNDRLHPSLHEVDAALTTTQSNGGNSYAEGLRSYISRINYVAYDKYLLEVNFRSDGSSKFAEGNKWGFFPSAALGWRFSEENFIKDFTGSWLTSGKLRLSYGTLGNNSGVGRYEQKYTLSTANYMIGGSSVKGFNNKKLVNAALSWETTTVKNLGLDLSFLKGRLGVELDYYDRLTTDMIQDSDMSLMISGAYTSIPRTNVGNLRNRGVEANITWRDKIGNLKYSVGVNVSYNRTNLEEWNQYLGRGSTFLDMPYHFVYSYEDIGLAQSWQDVYSNGINNSSAPGDIIYLDLNGDGILNDNDKKAYPNVQYDQPTTNFALNGYLEWKGIDFTFLFQGAAGRKDFWLNVYNNLNPGVRYAANEGHWDNPWSWDNRDSNWPRLGGYNNSSESTYWLDDLTYLRLKNLQLGYNLPQKWIGKIKIDRVRIYCTAENLLTLTNYRGLDPEIVVNNRNAAYPLVKSYSIGINIGF